jgi:hypothetical protein
MSYRVENTEDDLEILQGAKITSIAIVPDEYDSDKIVMTVHFRTGLRVNDALTGTFEVWMDAEGNGPGFLAFVGE